MRYTIEEVVSEGGEVELPEGAVVLEVYKQVVHKGDSDFVDIHPTIRYLAPCA